MNMLKLKIEKYRKRGSSAASGGTFLFMIDKFLRVLSLPPPLAARNKIYG